MVVNAIVVLIATASWASENPNNLRRSACEDSLEGTHEIVQLDGKDERTPQYEEALESLIETAKDLGFKVPPHIATFLTPDNLKNFVAVGARMPIPHYTDGAILTQPNQHANGVMELVHPGCPVCRSFNNSRLPLNHQIQIFAHVIGHNDFFANSLSHRRLGADPVKASYELAELMNYLYETEDKAEVSEFVRQLRSLNSLQDYGLATFDHPDEFADENPRRLPSASVLQALIENLPAQSPPWKKQLLSLYEQTVRSEPSNANTKIMNEGWAVFAQYILTAYSKWQSHEELWDFGELLEMAIRPDFGNPYWLGSRAWLNLWEEYRNRSPDQDPKEQVRGFVAEAHQKIAFSTDREFLLEALNDRWIRELGIGLGRPAQRDEMQPIQVPQGQQQFVVVTRDPKRIREALVDRFARKERFFPRVKLANFRAEEHYLHLVHEPVDDLNLEHESLVQVLYDLSLVMGRTIIIQTIIPGHWIEASEEDKKEDPPPTVPVFVRVTPEGVADVATGEGTAPHLTKIYQEALNRYRDQLRGMPGYRFTQLPPGVTQASFSKVIDERIGPQVRTLSVDSWAADAVREYARVVRRRLPGALSKVFSGKVDSDPGSNSIDVQVLPPIPRLHFDPEVYEQRRSEIEPAPLDDRLVTFSSDDGADITGGQRKVGDIFLGPKPQGGGQGKGQGKSKPGDSPKPGNQPGNGPQPGGSGSPDPMRIEIPIEIYGQYLANQIEIPNLEPRGGGSEVDAVVRQGNVRNPVGLRRNKRTMRRLLAKAIAMRQAEGRPWEGIPVEELIQEALQKYHTRSDIVVADKRPLETPQIKIVVEVVIDLTGSMKGKPLETARKILFNLKAMLQAKYDQVEFRFIGFNTEAQEFGEEDIGVIFLDGGTKYIKGIELAKEIDKEYGPDWNRMMVVIGDLEDEKKGEPSSDLLVELSEFYEFIAVFLTPNSTSNASKTFEAACKKKPSRMGYAAAPDKPSAVSEALLKIFGKKKSKAGSR